MIKQVGKRGDTLIEVMLAVGIFSMVAVAVVAVMSGGTSSAQTSLETTLAREEIDTQAEALRFIHRSYIADKNAGTSSAFGRLWQNIVGRAVNNNAFGAASDIDAAVTQFHPDTCNELYAADGDAIRNKGFIINPKALASVETTGAYAPVLSGNTYLQPASTYPHLLYSANENNTTLIDQRPTVAGSGPFYRAEGIYIVAVRDPNSTALVGSERTSAYYDFYIRTCWYGTGDQKPSTISTVIRLYNPDIAQ